MSLSRYADVHKSPEGPGDARPTALQIIQDEGLEGKLAGKVIKKTQTPKVPEVASHFNFLSWIYQPFIPRSSPLDPSYDCLIQCETLKSGNGARGTS